MAGATGGIAVNRVLLIAEEPGKPTLTTVSLDADTLTTHGVILGMTGSGKTGLAIVILEELARQGVPLVICDLKGDMTNLLLTFPDLRPEDFAPYLPVSEAAGGREAAAAAVASRWREGLARWSLGAAETRQVKERVDWRLLTPGSGVAPVDLLPALRPPDGYDPDADPDGSRARLDGTAAALLALVDRGGDPLSDRDHVLMATLLDTAWRAGRGLDFAELIRQVADPPVERFGVLDAESFYPRRERQQLVLALNTLLASPSFAVWTRGAPLTVDELIGSLERPRATILYLAHLGDRERLSLLTLLFSTVLSWTRVQPGSESLRVLLYLDEVQGIIPPTANPPTKSSLLALFKQGRAFGTGVLVATQNPVDLDYKALGNAGVKLVGRLDTENDRNRALEGLDLAGGDLDAVVAGLAKRQFLLAGARVGAPHVIASRWAMSYLRGPLTLAELKPLAGAPTPLSPTPPPSAEPPLLPGVEQRFGEGSALRAAVLVEGRVTYRKAQPAVFRELEQQWLAPFEGTRIAWERLTPAPELVLEGSPPEEARLEGLPANAAELVRDAARGFAAELDSRPLEVAWHRRLGLVQDEGEGAEAFAGRCREALAKELEAEREKVRGRWASRLAKIEARLERERLELERDQSDLSARERARQLTVVEGVGDALLSGLGALLGGGRRRGATSAVRRGAGTLRRYQEKDRMADRARAEVDESLQSIAALEGERARLEAERERELAALSAALEGDAETETLRLTPAGKDIAVRRVLLAWLDERELP
jgi:hypothetical protein